MVFNGLQSRNRCSNPINPVDITHIDDISLVDNSVKIVLPNILIDVTVITISKAVGIALLRMYFKNEPFTLLLLGSSASINDGIPIHIALIKVSCIGTNGYCIVKIINIKSNSME